jgi:spore coat polysaccharide biosynthesis predicted glycosyltransferase SpsG
MAKKLLFRFDSDERVGTGHFMRCRSLAYEAKQQGFEVLFVAKHLHKGVERYLREDGEEYLRVPDIMTWREEAAYLLQTGGDRVNAAIIDVSTIYALQDIPGISVFFKTIRSHWPVVLLDGMWDNAIAGKVDTHFDMLVIPYVGAEAFDYRGCNEGVRLTGPKFFIVGPEYNSVICSRREIRDTAVRLLISFGGSDQNCVTLKVLDALTNMDDRILDVRVIVGPGFSLALQSKIEQRGSSLRHNCEIIQCPRSLAEHMFWCDMAVTNSGLTKYELALTGTPSLQISMDKEHARVNEPFASTGASQHLGVWYDLTVEEIREAIVGLMEDKRRRERMRNLGQEMLDTRGALRVVEETRRLLDAEPRSPQSHEGLGV